MDATNIETLRNLSSRHLDLLLDCGFTKSPALVTLEDKISMVQAITLQHVILQCKGEADQFIEGIKSLGVLDAMRDYPDLFRNFFSLSKLKLTSGIMQYFL